MPSDDLLLHFARDMHVVDRWSLSGTHYAKTCNAWLAKLDSNRGAALAILGSVYTPQKRLKAYVNWRLFFMACAELFDFSRGNEWGVSHYLFAKSKGSGASSESGQSGGRSGAGARA